MDNFYENELTLIPFRGKNRISCRNCDKLHRIDTFVFLKTSITLFYRYMYDQNVFFFFFLQNKTSERKIHKC